MPTAGFATKAEPGKSSTGARNAGRRPRRWSASSTPSSSPDDAKYLEAARRVWDYIEQHLVDRVHGEWFWRINADGRPDPDLPKVSEWKGPYHGSRACLETLRRLKQIVPNLNRS